MIKVTVEVRDRATSRRVSITAPSIERALELAGDRLPGRSVRVVFPISPEEFFVKGEAQQIAELVVTSLQAA